MQALETKDGIPAYHFPDQASWRAWLASNHAKETRVWLILYGKDSGVPAVTYAEAVEEALCYGWIDSKPNKRDEKSRYQYFSQRKPKSVWSKINKAKVETLIAEGRMAPAGMQMIELAKQNGMWEYLDPVDNEVVPSDLEEALAAAPVAKAHFEAFSPSTRKVLLYWVISAKTTTTRDKRIKELIDKASRGERANEWKPKEK